MTLDEVIRFTKQALENVNPDKRVCTEFRFTVEQVKQLLEWLEEYHKIKECWLPSDEEELRKERGECNNLYDKIDIVVSGLYSKIADQIIEKIGLENKYKQLEADYIELNNRLRTANTENDELKRMLKNSLEALDAMAENVRDECGEAACGLCEYDSPLNEYDEMIYECEGVNGKTDCFKWRHYDEAMKLLGGAGNAEN